MPDIKVEYPEIDEGDEFDSPDAEYAADARVVWLQHAATRHHLTGLVERRRKAALNLIEQASHSSDPSVRAAASVLRILDGEVVSFGGRKLVTEDGK